MEMEQEINIANSTGFHKINGSNPTSETPPMFFIVLMILFAVWVTTVNALVLVCVLTSKGALKTIVSIQILGFSATDMFVGISVIPVILTFQITTAFPYFEACALIFYVYSTLQTANLFHAFGICIHRIVTIKRRTLIRDTHPKHVRTTFCLQMLCVWLASAIVVAVPFLLYGRFGATINQCSFTVMFADNYIAAVGYLNVIFLMPQLGMSFMYIYMSRYLLSTWRQVNIKRLSATRGTSEDPHANYSTTVITKSSDQKSTDKKIPCPDIANHDQETEAIENSISILNGSSEDKKYNGRRNVVHNSQMCLKDDINQLNINSASGSSSLRFESESTSAVTSSKPDTVLEPKQFGQFGYKAQKEVLITIGLIVLVQNIFMTPVNVIVLIELINVDLLDRKVKFSLFLFSFMNSALNPFVYSLRIKAFKNAIRENLKRFVPSICRCR